MIAFEPISGVSDLAELSFAANQIWNIATTKSALGENTIVSICGGSCTGKSTQIARGLLNIFDRQAQVISQDHFMLASIENDMVSDSYRWDHPDSFNLTESARIMDQLRKGTSCVMPFYSFKTRRCKGIVRLNSTAIVLFEGLYAGYDFLRKHADYVIYVEMPLYARMTRRLVRNMYERYTRSDPQSILESYLNAPLKAHMEFVITQRDGSDIVLKPEYDFPNTINKFNLQSQSWTENSNSEIFFTFISGDDLRIEIRETKGSFCFVLSHKRQVYLQFPIEKSTFEKLAGLDFYAV